MSDHPLPTPTEREPAGQPGMGCIIFACATAIFSGIICYGLYSGVRQSSDIAKFTDETKIPTPLESGTTEEWKALAARFEEFSQEAEAGGEAEISLSVRDLNLAIANADPLLPSREQLFFRTLGPEAKIDGDEIRIPLTAQICWPIQKLKFWEEPRYLNADATLLLEFSRKDDTVEGKNEVAKLFLRATEIRSRDGRPIEPGFLERVAQIDLLTSHKQKESPLMAPILAIDEVALVGEEIVLRAKPAQK